MAGGGGGAVGMRLNIMTALYLPILGYAMSTFDINPDALVISSGNLKAYAVASQKTVPIGQQFEASILYELVPTEEQRAALQVVGAKQKPEEASAKNMFKPKVKIKESSAPGIYWDSVDAKFYLDTQVLEKDFKDGEITKDYTFSASIVAQTIGKKSFEKEIEESFTVFKPYVDVQSNAAPRLLADCENSLKFSAVGYDATQLVLSDKSTGTTVNGNSITWSPRGDTTVVTISVKTPDGKTNVIDRKGFRVTPTPPPSIYVRRENELAPITGEELVNLNDFFELIVKPDASFASDFPKDSRYKLDEIRVEIGRRGLPPLDGSLKAGDNLIVKEDRARGEFVYKIDLFDAVGQNPLGSNVVISVAGLSRVNYKGKSIPVDITTVPSTFAFNAQ